MTKKMLLILFFLSLSSETVFSRKAVSARPAPPQSPDTSSAKPAGDTTSFVPQTPKVPENPPAPKPAIARYSKDEELDLSHYPVKLTRPNVAAFQNLKKLVLDFNGLHEIPPYIGDLKNLEILSIGYNHIHRLPESLGNLENLKELNITCNRVFRLPQSLSRIKGLKIVMSNNRLSIGMQEKLKNEFPDAIFYFMNQEDDGANEGGG